MGRRRLLAAAGAVFVAIAGCTFGSLDGLAGSTSDDGGPDASSDALTIDDADPPSCQGLAPTCGPAMNGDCCEAALVPGGTFNRLNDASTPATLSAYRLDLYEVTVGRFRRYVASLSQSDGDIVKAEVVCSGGTWTDAPAANETLPITCVVRKHAFAFCAWDGARPMTDAEWNFAAAGGTDQRYFPWSDPPSSMDIGSDDAVSGAAVLPVGSRPDGAGRWGQFDLSGNAYEIVADGDGPLPVPCVDCVIDAGTPGRLLHRGGGLGPGDGGFDYSTVFRDGNPDTADGDQGMRCRRPASP